MEVHQVNIVSYNIAGNHEEIWGTNQDQHINKLSQFFSSIKADVICLQEVSGSKLLETQAHKIAQELRMNCAFAPAIEKKVYGVAILSHFPISSIQHLPLPRGSLFKDNGDRMPGQNETRVALCTRISPIKDDPTFDFICICTHFGIYNSEDINNEKALEPVKIIHDYINQNKIKETPALLVGDLNTTPNSEMWQRLDKNWNMHASDATTNKRKIDYICDRGRGKYQMQPQQVRRDIDLSDHFPLIAIWKRKL